MKTTNVSGAAITHLPSEIDMRFIVCMYAMSKKYMFVALLN